MAFAVLLSVFFQWKDNPLYAWTLIVFAFIVVAVTYYSRTKHWLTDKSKRLQRDRIARRTNKDFIRMRGRLAKFANSQDHSNLRQIVFAGCGNNSDELAKYYASDFLPPFLGLFAHRWEKNSIKNEEELITSTGELKMLVAVYNSEYVQEPLRRLRRDQWLAKLAEGSRDRIYGDIEQFRERWVRFLDDFQEWMEKLNVTLGYRAFESYFERPQKL